MVLRLLVAVAFLVLVRGLGNFGSWALEHRLMVVVEGTSCPVTCGIFLDQGSNLCPLHWQVDS